MNGFPVVLSIPLLLWTFSGCGIPSDYAEASSPPNAPVFLSEDVGIVGVDASIAVLSKKLEEVQVAEVADQAEPDEIMVPTPPMPAPFEAPVFMGSPSINYQKVPVHKKALRKRRANRKRLEETSQIQGQLIKAYERKADKMNQDLDAIMKDLKIEQPDPATPSVESPEKTPKGKMETQANESASRD